MERHGISDVIEPMQHLLPYWHGLSTTSDVIEPMQHLPYFGLSRYSVDSLQLQFAADTIFIHEFLVFLSEDWLDSEEKKFINDSSL